ncbi:MAG: amidohydrolase [Gammaproteobacteria bacterium]
MTRTTSSVMGLAAVPFLTWGLAGAASDEIHSNTAQVLESAEESYEGVALEIYRLAELGYLEFRSTRLLQETLSLEGFEIEAGVAGIPTAFVASYGSGRPVVALLGEFDALPGISQAVSPVREPLAEQAAGHACGHHLFGVGSAAAAIAVKEWLSSRAISGTIRYYGTPAEEGGSGKVYMVREGLFDDVDVVLHWHPSDENDASPSTSLANRSAKFRFYGLSSHASSAPQVGRSALDGVEAMNHMVNLMREHIPSTSRIHYVITAGGSTPNVVPDYAEVFYYVRGSDAAQVESLWLRLLAAAQGAAEGTETRLEYEVIHGNHSVLPNEVLARVMDNNLRMVGGVSYNQAERLFAEQLYLSLVEPKAAIGDQNKVQDFEAKDRFGSTDVGDISWVVPTAGLRVATFVPGTVNHSWQAIAAGGTSIGTKGMMVAARTLATTAIDLLSNSALIEDARAELLQRQGEDFQYRSLLGERLPPLDYRL